MTREELQEEVLRDNLARVIIMAPIYKYALQSVATSPTIAALAKIAKANKNKNWVDLRIPTANAINGVNALLMQIKNANIQPSTWRGLNQYMSSETLHEISITLDEIVSISDVQQLEEVRQLIVNYKNSK